MTCLTKDVMFMLQNCVLNLNCIQHNKTVSQRVKLFPHNVDIFLFKYFIFQYLKRRHGKFFKYRSTRNNSSGP